MIWGGGERESGICNGGGLIVASAGFTVVEMLSIALQRCVVLFVLIAALSLASCSH